MTYTINGIDYTFFPATMDDTPVIGLSYTRNGESFAEWSAEAGMPNDASEAQTIMELGWEILDSQSNFREVAE